MDGERQHKRRESRAVGAVSSLLMWLLLISFNQLENPWSACTVHNETLYTAKLHPLVIESLTL